MAFVRVAAVADIGEGQGTLVEHGGLTIALFNAGSGRFVACSPTCPHEDGPLVEGWLDGNAVVCPWHGYEYSIKTGRHQGNSRMRLRQAKLKIVGSEIYVVL